ncbi:hypothetical protein A9Q96_12915 [Rhodobacterales bacterium 52_120_T64]|nr:hypothetical protein A9Q96_12915 [Rhodobacterales bacterium 52_120_T64]
MVSKNVVLPISRNSILEKEKIGIVHNGLRDEGRSEELCRLEGIWQGLTTSDPIALVTDITFRLFHSLGNFVPHSIF